MNDARKFIQKRKIRHAKVLFLQTLEYVVFCYNRLKQDNEKTTVCYRKTDVDFAFEDWLKIRLVEDYLQQQRDHFHYSTIKEIRFQYETEKMYKDTKNKQRRDKIDIFITNLGLQTYWSGVVEEDVYFSIECKRLKNRSKNAEYLTDIQKFTEREYKFRFLFEGMIGFVEKSSIDIVTIINDINKRLQDTPSIITTQELTPFKVKNFQYHRLSKHKKNFPPNAQFEVHHLFFDYSNMIVD